MLHLIENTSNLKKHILRVLYKKNQHEQVFSRDVHDPLNTSGVMFLLGKQSNENRSSPEPCLILNKRSRKIRQAGDLCCPGGSIAPRLDSYLAKLLTLPVFPLARWPYWSQCCEQRPHEARLLALLFATSLRESFEEMRLNPLCVEFLGPLPSERLRMRQQIMYPMVAWISRQKRFVPNREVEKIVYIPLRNLLNPAYYARYQLDIAPHYEKEIEQATDDFPCFLHQNQKETERLWGATYRVVMTFLELVFGFKPPDTASLPIVPGILDENYFTGQ